MIAWSLIDETSFGVTAKLIKYMSFEEFEYVLHTPIKTIEEDIKPYIPELSVAKIKILKDATMHYTNLKKMNVMYFRKKLNKKEVSPKIELVKFGANGEFIETWLIDEKTSNRIKKVCGKSLKGYRPWYVCQNKAGQKTSHEGYGYCRSCEMKETNEARNQFWMNLKTSFGNVPTLVDLVERAEATNAILHDTLDGDVAYLELAREALIAAANDAGKFSKEMRQDLTVITDIMTRVKERKVKLQQMNWIPPEQVGALILQVLNAVTNGEEDSVKARIAARAKDLTNILIPRIEDTKIFAENTMADLKKGTDTAQKWVARPYPTVQTTITPEGTTERKIVPEETFPWTQPTVEQANIIEETKEKPSYNHNWRRKTSAAQFDEVKKPNFKSLIKDNDAPRS